MSQIDLSGLEQQLSDVGNLWGGLLDPASLMREALEGKTSVSPLSLVTSFLKELLNQMTDQSGVVLKIVGIAYLAVFLLALYQSEQPAWQDTATLAVVAILAVPVVASLVEIAMLAQETLGEMEVMMVSSLPLLASVSLNVGSPMFVLLAQGTALLLRHVFLPLALLYGGLGICEAISPHFPVGGIKRMVKSFFSWGLGITMTLFAGITAVTGILAGSTATLGKRAAKYAAGTLVPVVGPYLAEATDLVFSGANSVKNAGGIGMMAAVLVLCAVPFLKMLSVVVLYRLAGVLVQPVAEARVNMVLTASVEALTMIMGLTALLGVMYLINISAMITAGVG